MKIFPTITCITKKWKEKLQEADDLNIKEVCFFPTTLEKKEREEAYQLLLKSKIKEIPFVHIRRDMHPDELDFLINNFNTKRFNTHSEREYPNLYDFSKYKDLIFIENTHQLLNKDEVNKWAGICLDFSHLENDRMVNPEKYEKDFQIIKNRKIGCNHISAIKSKYYNDIKGGKRYDNHFSLALSDFDYLFKYDKSLFSDFIAIELENNLKYQLKVINYLNEKI